MPNRKTIAIMAVAAAAIGVTVPFFFSADTGPAMTTWVVWAPTLVDGWLLPEEGTPQLVLAMAVLTLQHLALFAAVALAWPAGGVLKDFVRGPKHRSGLVR